MRHITEADALSIAQGEEVDHFPARYINDAGRAAVSEWVTANARGTQNMPAWYADAECAANDALPGEAIIIEIRAMNSLTGNPITLTLDPGHFDWMAQDEC